MKREYKKWSAEEIKYLKENWGVIPIDEMDLDRTYNAIYLKALKLKLGPKKKQKEKIGAKRN